MIPFIIAVGIFLFAILLGFLNGANKAHK